MKGRDEMDSDNTEINKEPVVKEMNEIEEAARLFDAREYTKAFEIYRKNADDGDRLSKCRMGEMYYEGHGVDKRPLKAFQLIKESYDPKCPETVFQLGKCHFEGIGTPENKELGFEMIISLAEEGYPPAENYVSVRYHDGDYPGKDKEKMLFWLNRAVAHEDPKALYNMGKFLFEGKIVPMNQYEAVKLWKRSSELHCIPATGRLGYSYLKGEGCKKDVDKGLELLEKAALEGDGSSAVALGDFYSTNKEMKDKDKATKFYEIALQNGDYQTLFDLGFSYREKDPKKAIKYYKKGYERGDKNCSVEYALMKYFGIGCKEDEELAFRIMLKYAEEGDGDLMWRVGYCYQHGIGTTPDPKKAKEWFQRGNEKGNAKCAYSLAEFYFYGIMLMPDPEYAMHLLRISFERGEENAAFKLGDIYETDKKFKSIPDAIYWYMAGSEEGDCDCMIRLAKHYESGAFITGSEEKAFELYKKAYETDKSDVAAAEIGRCYEDGIGTEMDVEKAINWYLKGKKHNSFSMWRLYNIYSERGESEKAVFWLRRSAKNGSVGAMVELARAYEEGVVIPKSDLKAMQWYHRAADEGNEYAKSRFEELIRFDPADSDNLTAYDRFFRMAGEDEDDGALSILAHMLTEGKDIPADLPKAKMLLEIAVQLGLPSANEKLKKVSTMIKAEKKDDGKQTTLD